MFTTQQLSYGIYVATFACMSLGRKAVVVFIKSVSKYTVNCRCISVCILYGKNYR